MNVDAEFKLLLFLKVLFIHTLFSLCTNMFPVSPSKTNIKYICVCVYYITIYVCIYIKYIDIHKIFKYLLILTLTLLDFLKE